MRPCSICGRPDLAAIDAELARGDSLRTVEAAHPGTHKDALARHKAQGHSGQVAPAPPREAAPPPRASRPAKPGPPPAPLEEPGAEDAPAPPRAAPRLRLVPPPQQASGAPRRPGTRPRQFGGDGPKAAQISDREARVREIMAIMTAGAWDGAHDTHAELAIKWGCAIGSVHTYAGEASRRIRAVGEADWVRTRISTALDEALTLGLAMARGGDSKALIGLAQVAKGFSAIAIGNAPSAHAEATFRIEMVSPERPVLEVPAEPPAASDDERVVN